MATTRIKVVAVVAVMVAAFLVGLLTDWSLAGVDHDRRFRIDRCLEDEVVSARGHCVHPDTAEFRRGYWYGGK